MRYGPALRLLGNSLLTSSLCAVHPFVRETPPASEVSPPVAHLLTLYSQSKHSDLQQRCLEFLQLAREGPAAMAAVLPVDASCEDVEVSGGQLLSSIARGGLLCVTVGVMGP